MLISLATVSFAEVITCLISNWYFSKSSVPTSASMGVTADRYNVHGEGVHQGVVQMQVSHTCRDAHPSPHIALGQHLPVQQVNEGAMYSTSTRLVQWSCGGASSSSEPDYQLRQSVLPNSDNAERAQCSQTMPNVPNSRSIFSPHVTRTMIGPALPSTSMIDSERLWARHTHWLQPDEQWLPGLDFVSVFAGLP